MIYFFIGENSFEIERRVRDLTVSFDGNIERFDGAELTIGGLYDALTGQSLFSTTRLVIIKQLSENTALWEKLPDILSRIGNDVQLILIESKPDKRTRTYKSLQKSSDVTEFLSWSGKDRHLAISWAQKEAAQQGLTLSVNLAARLVDRVGFDQWRLFHAIEKLMTQETVTVEIIDDIIEARPSENVFQLFETALRADRQRLAMMLETLQQTQEPHMIFGLLSSQVYQLIVLSTADAPIAQIAKDIGAFPGILSKLQPYARDLSAVQRRKLVTLFVDADDDIKSSSGEPWLLIERCLFGVTTI